MRRCKIPTGCKRLDTPCCVDCKDKTCLARCQNQPQWCNCWEEAPPPRRGAPRRLDWDKVRHLHEAGLSQLQIAAQLDTCPQTVNKILRRLEAEKHGNP